MSISVNGSTEKLPADPRVSLLDYLREHLQLRGAKKGCDQGACVPSHVTADLSAEEIALSRDELRERMSGNLRLSALRRLAERHWCAADLARARRAKLDKAPAM